MSTSLKNIVRGRRPVTRSQTNSLPARKPSFAQEIQEAAGPRPRKSKAASKGRRRGNKAAPNNRASKEDAARVHKKGVSRVCTNSHTAQAGPTQRRPTAEELFSKYNRQPRPPKVESGLRLLRNGVRETPQKSAEWTVAGHQKRMVKLGELEQADRSKALRLRCAIIENAVQAGDMERSELSHITTQHLLAQIAYHVCLDDVDRDDRDALMRLPESFREKMRRSLLTCLDRETRPPVYFHHPQIFVQRNNHLVPKNNLEGHEENPEVEEEE